MALPCSSCWRSSRGHLSYNGLPPYVHRVTNNTVIHSTFIDHWQDVLVGSLLGLVLSYFCYRQYYPSLASEFSHRPYSPRIKREDDGLLPFHASHGSRHSGHQPSVDRPLQGNVNGYDTEDQELESTVKRPGPQRLSDGWRENVQTGGEQSNVQS
jgi:hypothetical protein